MSPASAMKAKPTASKVPVVASDKLPRTKVWGETDPAVSWAGPSPGTKLSSTIVYEIEPPRRAPCRSPRLR